MEKKEEIKYRTFQESFRNSWEQIQFYLIQYWWIILLVILVVLIIWNL